MEFLRERSDIVMMFAFASLFVCLFVCLFVVYCLLRKISQAAVCCMSSKIIPASRELQQSIADRIREQAISAAVSAVNKGRIETVLRSSR